MSKSASLERALLLRNSLKAYGIDAQKLFDWLYQWYPIRPAGRETKNSIDRLKRDLKQLKRISAEWRKRGFRKDSKRIYTAAANVEDARLPMIEARLKPRTREGETAVLRMAALALLNATGKEHCKELAEVVSLVCQAKGTPYPLGEKALYERLRRHDKEPLALHLRRQIPDIKLSR